MEKLEKYRKILEKTPTVHLDLMMRESFFEAQHLSVEIEGAATSGHAASLGSNKRTQVVGGGEVTEIWKRLPFFEKMRCCVFVEMLDPWTQCVADQILNLDPAFPRDMGYCGKILHIITFHHANSLEQFQRHTGNIQKSSIPPGHRSPIRAYIVAPVLASRRQVAMGQQFPT